tara:strand:+ start:76 stop:363 length:288 start_codon:yes stop_codon:yes gene_type:complete
MPNTLKMNEKYNGTELLNEIVDSFTDQSIMKADGFDEAVIGIESSTMRLVYSESKCIEILRREMTLEDALEHFDYNIRRSSIGEQTPIWVNDFIY